MKKNKINNDVSVDTLTVNSCETSIAEEVSAVDKVEKDSIDVSAEVPKSTLRDVSEGAPDDNESASVDYNDVVLGNEDIANGILLKETDDVSMEDVTMNDSSESRAMADVLSAEVFKEAVPLFGWNKLSEDNGYDVQKCKVLCPELFLVSDKMPNSFIPKLDRAMSKANEFAKTRKESSACSEMAEFYGKYCALFLRTRVTRVVEEYIESKKMPEEYPCKMTAADLLNTTYDEHEVKAFWVGFQSEFPIGPEEIDMNFVSLFAKTHFGYILAHQLSKFCTQNFGYYLTLVPDFNAIKSREEVLNSYPDIDLEKCLY